MECNEFVFFLSPFVVVVGFRIQDGKSSDQ
jgi:hypothetical protein